MNPGVVDCWSRRVRRVAAVLACTWPLSALVVLANDPSLNAFAFAAMAVGCSGIGVVCMLPPERGLGWVGAPRVFLTLWALVWTATFVGLWLELPLLVRVQSVVGPAGAAVGRFFAVATLVIHAGALLLGVIVAALVAWFYRFIARARISRTSCARASGVALVLVCGGALVATFVICCDAAKRVPLDRYLQVLPVVQVLEGSRCAGFTQTETERRLVPRRCAAPEDWCEVDNYRQPTNAPCEALVLQRDEKSHAALVSARTRTGLVPIVWCRTLEHPDCPDVVYPSHVMASVTVPVSWRVIPWVGLGMVLICAATAWRVVRAGGSSGYQEDGDAKLDFVHHVFVIALVASLGTATPLGVALALGFR
jgi:hypothetical protein